MSLLLLARALAGDVVLHDGDVGLAVRAVAADAGVPADHLRPVRLPQLGEAPVLLGEVDPARCGGGPSSNGALREAVTRAEGRVAYQQWAQAIETLDAAAAGVPCLVEAAEASLLARLHFLRGYARLRGGVPGADADFRRAVTYQPGLGWDPKLPPDGQPAFDAAVAEGRRGPVGAIAVASGLGGATLWVDGRPGALADAELRLPAGPHLVQWVGAHGVATWELTVTPGRWTALVVPAALDPATVRTLGEPEAGRVVAALAAQAFPGDRVWAWTGTTTLRLDGDAWVATGGGGPRRPPLCAEPRRCAGHALLAGGLGLAVGGGVTALLGGLGGAAAADTVPGETADDALRRYGRADAWRTTAWVGGATAGAGVIGAVVGAVLQADGGRAVAVGPALAGGPGLTFAAAF